MTGANVEKDRPLLFSGPADFERWLEQNAGARAVWIKLAKKGSGRESISYEQAVDVALCFGWIDGQKASSEEGSWLQRFTPRTKASRWSRVNREKAERLIAAGRMRPAGLAEVQRARADGRWERAYAGQASAEVPDDVQRELDREPRAAAAFAALKASERYSIIWRLNDAKRPETRARRLAAFMEKLQGGPAA